MEKYQVILDTDIADDIDDSFALSLLLTLKNVNLLGVTSVYKNVRLRSKVLKYQLTESGFPNIPVASGIDKPISKDIIKFDYETEVDEFGKVKLTHYLDEMASFNADYDDAVSFMIEEVKKHPYEITLVAIGPLTNVANFYLRDPETFKKLKGILMMGMNSNSTRAEWNIFVDPKAAQIVIGSGVAIKAVEFQQTVKVSLTEADAETFRSMKNEANKVPTEMMNIWISDHKGRMPILHDALTVAELDSGFCEFKHFDVKISDGGKATLTENPNSNIMISTSVKDREFIKYIINKFMERE